MTRKLRFLNKTHQKRTRNGNFCVKAAEMTFGIIFLGQMTWARFLFARQEGLLILRRLLSFAARAHCRFLIVFLVRLKAHPR